MKNNIMFTIAIMVIGINYNKITHLYLQLESMAATLNFSFSKTLHFIHNLLVSFHIHPLLYVNSYIKSNIKRFTKF